MLAALKTSWAIVCFSVHLNGTVDTLKGRNTTQRCLDKFEIFENLMKFNKAKCKGLHLSYVNRKHKRKLDAEWIGSRSEKDLGVLVDKKLHISWQNMCLQPMKPTEHWASTKPVWPAGNPWKRPRMGHLQLLYLLQCFTTFRGMNFFITPHLNLYPFSLKLSPVTICPYKNSLSLLL